MSSPPKEKRFKIGDWVTVHTYVEFDYDNKQRIIKKIKETFDAQIVGGTIKQLGKVHGGYSGYDGWIEGEPAYLEIQKTVFVWIVRRGITNKEIYVLPEDLTYYENYEGKLPWKWTNSYRWTEKDKQFLSDEIKNAPRNKRGQFVKY